MGDNRVTEVGVKPSLGVLRADVDRACVSLREMEGLLIVFNFFFFWVVLICDICPAVKRE